MQMKKIITGAVLVVFGILAWDLLLSHRYECSRPLTVQEATRRSPVPLPASATNVYVATDRHMVAYSDYVRFEAPVDDCMAHAALLLGDDHSRVPITPDSPARWNFIGFKKGLSWFNIHNISNGTAFGGGFSPVRCWIDSDRHIFYYCRTD